MMKFYKEPFDTFLYIWLKFQGNLSLEMSCMQEYQKLDKK